MKSRFEPTIFEDKDGAKHDGDTPGAQFGHETAEHDINKIKHFYFY